MPAGSFALALRALLGVLALDLFALALLGLIAIFAILASLALGRPELSASMSPRVEVIQRKLPTFRTQWNLRLKGVVIGPVVANLWHLLALCHRCLRNGTQKNIWAQRQCPSIGPRRSACCSATLGDAQASGSAGASAVALQTFRKSCKN